MTCGLASENISPRCFLIVKVENNSASSLSTLLKLLRHSTKSVLVRLPKELKEAATSSAFLIKLFFETWWQPSVSSVCELMNIYHFLFLALFCLWITPIHAPCLVGQEEVNAGGITVCRNCTVGMPLI